MQRHTYNSLDMIPKYPTRAAQTKFQMQHGGNTEVVWYHDMLNLNFNLEILINLVKLDLSWKLMHMGAKVLFKTLFVGGCF